MKKIHVVFFVLINFISIMVLKEYNDSDGIIMKFLMILAAFIVVHSVAILPMIFLWKKTEIKEKTL